MPIDAANPVPPTTIRPRGLDQVPPHVPAELVFRTGLTSGPEFLASPHEYMADLHRTRPPIYYDVSDFGNMWHFIKHEDALFALRHPELFSNEGNSPFPRDPDDYFYFIPPEIDPPHHRKYRNIVDPMFSPAGVKKLEGKIRQLANELIDRIIDKGECEFTTAFSRPLPVLIFLELVGLPKENLDLFVTWADDLMHSESPEVMGRTLKKITTYLTEVIREKQAHPDEGVFSVIANARVDGQPLAYKEILGFCTFLFIGGLDTVYATLNNVWLWLARHPERRREIISRMDADADKIVEELLRRYSVTYSGREVAQDLEMRGVQLRKGDRITCILPACNFDPDVFPDPLAVDFDRPRKTILAFTVGVHSCMGGHLARLETKIALQEWLRRIPDFGVRPGATIEYRPGGVIGPHHVPLTW